MAFDYPSTADFSLYDGDTSGIGYQVYDTAGPVGSRVTAGIVEIPADSNVFQATVSVESGYVVDWTPAVGSTIHVRDVVEIVPVDAANTVGAFPAAALVNVPKTGYTMNGTTGAVGPTAGVATADIYGQVFKNGTRPLCARVYLEDGTDAQQADITAITYTIYLLDANDKDAREAIAGHTDVSVTVASVIFDTLQTDQVATNYNMKHTPDISTNQAFTIAGESYLVEYTITPASGQDIIARHRLACI